MNFSSAPLLLFLAANCIADEITIVGIEGELRDNVREFTGTAPGCDASDQAVARYADRLPERLQPALDAFGYYHAQIRVQLEPRAQECWHLRLTVEPGEPTLVRNAAVRITGEAQSDAPMQTLLAAFPLPPGSVLWHGEYLAFKGRLESLATERGYLDGGFSAERIDVYVDERVADIELTFDSGPHYVFGAVTFNTTALDDEVLQSFVPFMAGQQYDAALLARLQRDLAGSEYFAATNVRAEHAAAQDRQTPIRVDVTEGEPASYSVGVGYSTDDGPRLRFLHQNQRRNPAGHQTRTDVLLSPVRQSAVVDYRMPRGNPQRDWLSLRAGLEREDIDAGVGTALRVGARRTRVGEFVTVTRLLDVLFERDDAGREDLSTTLLVPGISWVRTRRDDLVRPREGHRSSFEMSAGLGSAVSLLHVELSGKWITSTAWDARVLTRARVGAVAASEPLDRVPLTMRFFAGGDNSVRGYDYQSLGPHGVEGELIGGDRLLEGSVEYEHPVHNAWSAAVFVDAGNALFAGEHFDVRVGAGIGARWLSPLGPVRFDVAWPLDGEDRSPQLHISMGPDL